MATSPDGPALGWPATTVLVVTALALLGWASVHWAGAGRGVAVVRRGRVVRLAVCGPVVRLPAVEEVREWPTDAIAVPLAVRASTRDGVGVRVVAELRATVAAPAAGAAYVDPVRAAQTDAEDHLAAEVRASDLEELHRLQPAGVRVVGVEATADQPTRRRA